MRRRWRDIRVCCKIKLPPKELAKNMLDKGEKMDRRALLLYLRDIRDLEVAKNKIQTIYNHEKELYSNQVYELNRISYKDVPERVHIMLSFGTIIKVLILWMVGIYLISFMYYMRDDMLCGKGEFVFWILLGVFPIICGAVLIVQDIRHKKYLNRERNNVIKHNENEKIKELKNGEKRGLLIQEWKKRERFLNTEYNRVALLLQSFYNQNILANQYRNLASVYYIYDYMSSSQESLKDTLIHEHMENGIQRILAKLNTIVEQNETIIFQNRILEADNKRMIEQNMGMLDSLNKMEQNTYEAAQYAKWQLIIVKQTLILHGQHIFRNN